MTSRMMIDDMLDGEMDGDDKPLSRYVDEYNE